MVALVLCIFIAGYVLITLEHRYHLHKAITAAALGAVLWLIIALREGSAVQTAIGEADAAIFALIFFLLAAMTLVEILAHYRFFDWIRARLLALGLRDYGQLWVMGGVAFLLSAVIDNLTATLVMLAIVKRFFSGHNLSVAAGGIVIAANAGGAWSPIGDVTTIMLWLANKFTTAEVISWALLPSLTLFGVSMAILGRSIRGSSRDAAGEIVTLSGSEKVVVVFTLLSFLLPLVFNQIGLEPYFGLMFGLGLVGIVIAVFRLFAARQLGLPLDSLPAGEPAASHQTHLTADIESKLARTDIGSLLFFAGILLAVAALEHLGILEHLSHVLLGEAPGVGRYVGGAAALGVLSALVDNIPLTAAAISIMKTADAAIWSLLALTVGTGGSMLVIGSAAGVVAMGRVKDLTFVRYLRIAGLPAALGYAAAIGVWWLEYLLRR